MVVNKKIEKNKQIDDPLAYISKGGHVPCDMLEEIKEEWKTICIRVPSSLLDRVNEKVKQRAALTRTAWILEAIQDKLKGINNDES